MPAGVVTVIRALVAFMGTVARIMVGETTVNDLATPSPNVTASAAEAPAPKPEPLIVTTLPARALIGLNEVIFGSTRNVSALVTVPPIDVIVIFPVTAVVGTVTRSLVGDRI